MKKLIVTMFTTILFITFTGTLYAADSATTVTRSDAILKVVQSLYDGVYNNEEKFDIDSYYCIHASGYTHFVSDNDLIRRGYPALCAIYNSVKGPSFSDINLPENAISLAKEMGIINGFPDGTFHPREELTYGQAYAILTSAFYRSKINPNSLFPNDSITIAKSAGFFNELAQTNTKITTIDFDRMLNSCIQNTKDNIRNSLFIPAFTADECVSYYANAIKSRNGIIQYALFESNLQERYRTDFENRNWVTGVSDSWVESFSINNINNLDYEIDFNWATSTQTRFTTTLRIGTKAINLGEATIYLITGIENL